MRRSRRLVVVAAPVLALCLALLVSGRGQAAPSPGARCRAAKNAIAGKYAACRQDAEARYATTADGTRYLAALAKCGSTFERAWQKAIDKAAAVGATCVDAPLTAGAFKTVIDEHASTVSSALGGGGLPLCSADLVTCNGQVATCDGDLAVCEGDRETCESDLDACRDQFAYCIPSTCGNGLIDSGEDCDLGSLNGETCISRGFGAGRLACGPRCKWDTRLCSQRFISYGATVIDVLTGLEWAKKYVSVPSDPHNVTNTYSWGDLAGCPSPGCPNGTAYTDFLAYVNYCTPYDQNFIGHCDWRMPTINELKSIVDLAAPGCGTGPNACIPPIFGPTSPDCCYLSNTTDDTAEDKVLGVRFSDGAVTSVQKVAAMFVRAVRNSPQVEVAI